MSEEYVDLDDDVAEDIPLHHLRAGRTSHDSANSSDFDHLLSEDGSETSSTADLPPVDGGRGAWVCLAGCWLVEAMIWGFPLAFGVFQRHYSALEAFKGSSSIPTIGTLATGMSYLGMPFTNPIALRWPRYRRIMCAAGFLLCMVGLIGASFAQQVWQLLLFQGFVYGCGWVICYTPFLFMLNEWFVERRGLAYGILFGASGVSGLVIPVGMEWMLERFEFRTALRVYVVLTAVIGGVGLFFIRPRRVAIGQAQEKKLKSSALQALRPFATNQHFLLMATAIFLQGLGFFIPNLFIPSFAQGLGLSASASSGLLALVSFSQVLGQIWQGWISDRVNVYLPISLSALVSGLGALLLWGSAKGVAYLAPFALLWGFFSASYSVLYTRMCTYLTTHEDADEEDDTISMLLYGFFSFERGVSNILEGPISSWLIGKDGKPIDPSMYGLGRYASVIWFTVLCMLASSTAGVGWLWRSGRK